MTAAERAVLAAAESWARDRRSPLREVRSDAVLVLAKAVMALDAARLCASPPAACTADEGHPCDGGPDGSPCASCQAEHDYWRGRWATASPEDRDARGYERNMRDAGRGHLLHEGEVSP